MGVAQKTMFSISDRLAKFFGISGAPMEHNAIAKSKQTFFLQIRHKRPRTIWKEQSCKFMLSNLVGRNGPYIQIKNFVHTVSYPKCILGMIVLEFHDYVIIC